MSGLLERGLTDFLVAGRLLGKELLLEALLKYIYPRTKIALYRAVNKAISLPKVNYYFLS